jgi:hypothetical protein
MPRKYFGLYQKDKKCPSCKGPFHNPRNAHAAFCETCESKSCKVCGKISVLGAKATNEGIPLCPKHWSSFLRFKNTRLNMDWSSDREFKIWMENRGKHLEERMGLGLDYNLDEEIAKDFPDPDSPSPDPNADENTLAKQAAIAKMIAEMEKGK